MDLLNKQFRTADMDSSSSLGLSVE